MLCKGSAAVYRRLSSDAFLLQTLVYSAFSKLITGVRSSLAITG
jgi:hypothetical protein